MKYPKYTIIIALMLLLTLTGCPKTREEAETAFQKDLSKDDQTEMLIWGYDHAQPETKKLVADHIHPVSTAEAITDQALFAELTAKNAQLVKDLARAGHSKDLGLIFIGIGIAFIIASKLIEQFLHSELLQPGWGLAPIAYGVYLYFSGALDEQTSIFINHYGQKIIAVLLIGAVIALAALVIHYFQKPRSFKSLFIPGGNNVNPK